MGDSTPTPIYTSDGGNNFANGAKYFALNLWKNENNYSFTKTN